MIPHVVDGPLAIRLIKPKPMEVNIDGPRHPATWHQARRSVDPLTKRTSAPVLECDIDVGISNKQIRSIINMLRPHIGSVTVDVALIVGTPKGSEVEEVSDAFPSYSRGASCAVLCLNLRAHRRFCISNRKPSACLGLWRIDKIDFESAAVFPELAVEDAAEKVKVIMSGMETEEMEVAVEVAA